MQAFVLGAIGGLIPGAILTMILISSIRDGWWGAVRIFLWSALAEIIIAGALLFAGTLVPLNPVHFQLVGIAGGIMLLFLAYRVLTLQSVTSELQKETFSPREVFTLTATNAPLYIFWITVCFPLIFQLAEQWTLKVAAFTYFIAFEIGWCMATFLMLLIFVKANSLVQNTKIIHRAFTVVAILLGAFGVQLIFQGVLALL